MNTFNLSLDLDKEQGLPQLVTLRQGDKSGTTLVATIYDHGQLVSGSYTARVSLRHPGSGDTYYRETATYSNGVATVTVDEQHAATVAGVTTGYFELLQGSSVKASTADFIVRILPSAEDGAVPGEVYDSAIEDALAELDAATGRISQMVVDATAEYLAAHPEITTTVQDNSVTDAKLIQSGGVLDRVGRLWWRLENLLTNTPAEAESVTVSDAAKTPVAGLTVFGKSTQDGTPTPDSPVPISSVTAQNLLSGTQVNSGSKYVSNGITFDLGADGSLHIHGTATASSIWDGNWRRGFVTNAIEEAGAYILNLNNEGSLNGVACAVTYRPQTAGSQPSVTSVTGVSVLSFSLSESAMVDGNLLSVGFYVNSGTTVDVTVRPMLVAGSTAYPYVPYNHVGLWARVRNLLDEDTAYYVGQTAPRRDNGTFVFPPTTDTSTQLRFPFTEVGSFVLSFDAWSVGGNANLYTDFMPDSSQPSDKTFSVSASKTRITIPVTSNAGVNTLRFFRTDSAVGASSTTVYIENVQLERGSTAHAYEPYASSTTALPVDGHTLRSLPDGTRDEVTVDQYGHVTLTKRVGSATFDGSSDEAWEYQAAADSSLPDRHRIALAGLVDGTGVATNVAVGYLRCDRFKTVCDSYNNGGTYWGEIGVSARRTNSQHVLFQHGGESTADWRTWLASNPVTIDYALATPQTFDLGTIDPTALVGPDMTAQAIPTAPFALTYERDLNTTLARLEAALATLA